MIVDHYNLLFPKYVTNDFLSIMLNKYLCQRNRKKYIYIAIVFCNVLVKLSVISIFEFIVLDMNNHAEIDYASMDASMTSIGMNVKGLMHCVRLYDQLDTVNNNNGSVVDKTSLKQAAQALSDAFLDLMRTTFSSVSMDNSSDKVSLSLRMYILLLS